MTPMSNPVRIPMALDALRNLFTKPATRLYPDVKREPFAGARGLLVVDIDSCVFCGLCARRCPCAAITVARNDKTFAVEHLRCISCGICVDVCNKKSLSLAAEPLPIQLGRSGHCRIEFRKPDQEKESQSWQTA